MMKAVIMMKGPQKSRMHWSLLAHMPKLANVVKMSDTLTGA